MFWGAGALFSISDSIKFTKEKGYFTVDLLFYCFVVSRPTKPRCLCLSSEPGQLTFRISARVSLNHTDCIVPRTGLIQICQNVTVANRSQRLGIGRNASSNEPLYLLDQAGLKHTFHAGIDTAITLFARRIQTDRVDGEPLQGPPWFHFQVLRQRLPRLEPDLQRADDLGFVSGGNTAGRYRVETLKHAVKVFPSPPFCNSFQPGTPVG